MPIRIGVDLWQLLVYSAYGAAWALWGASLLLLGLRIGRNRGHRESPEVYKKEWREEHHRRIVAEERLETAEKVSKRFEVAMLQLAENREGPQLRAVK